MLIVKVLYSISTEQIWIVQKGCRKKVVCVCKVASEQTTKLLERVMGPRRPNMKRLDMMHQTISGENMEYYHKTEVEV